MKFTSTLGGFSTKFKEEATRDGKDAGVTIAERGGDTKSLCEDVNDDAAGSLEAESDEAGVQSAEAGIELLESNEAWVVETGVQTAEAGIELLVEDEVSPHSKGGEI
jgi:hypothetical protein